ncbi:MAG TPA: 16S rRNA (cytosine(1402)-N(4))-methyltransferase RsmH [Bryobacteraceae bacterium]|nr:16S rRNA (cytosine(1402)-N(4))-methyltransferase RsmH [Bryobacteraceae bacterium]
MHVPVMLEESLEYLAIRPDGVYLDATAGLGGHTRAIAQRLTSGFVIANDRDPESLEAARQSTAELSGRIRFHNGRFSELRAALAEAGVGGVDGILADLGVSRYQLTDPERGFSIMADGPLDMRMNRGQGETAGDIVNYYAEKALADLIFNLGEERRSRRIARAIVRARPIHTTRELANAVEQAVPRTSRLHPATQTFMALRLAVNGELEELESLLCLAPELSRPGGRIVIITFMSLEDRKVKQSFQGLVRSGKAAPLTKHVVRPRDEEVVTNPPSRSAKLRAVEMKQKAENGNPGTDIGSNHTAP